MQVSYKLVSGGGYTLLLDETAGDALESDAGTFRGAVQKEPLALSLGSNGAAYRAPIGNLTGLMRLRWHSVYTTLADARAAILTNAGLKTSRLHLKLVEGGVTHYLPNALADSYTYDRAGVAVTHEITFESDDLTSSAP